MSIESGWDFDNTCKYIKSHKKQWRRYLAVLEVMLVTLIIALPSYIFMIVIWIMESRSKK